MPLKRTPPKMSTTTTNLDVPITQSHSLSDPNLYVPSNSEPTVSCVTQRNKRRRDCHSDKSDFDEFKEYITDMLIELKTTVCEIKEQNIKLQASVDFTAQKYDEIMTKIIQIENIRKEDKKHIQSLEEKLDKIELQQRAASIEIRNIPKRNGENKQDLNSYLEDICKTVNTTFKRSDLKDIFRINKNISHKSTIIAEFNSVLTKENILKSVKIYNKQNKINKLNTEHLKIAGPKLPLYFSENLTSKNRRLFYLAREHATQENYKFCWTSFGKVYLRKEDGAPPIRIDSDNDIRKMAPQT